MAYVTETQLIERYGERMIVQLTDRTRPAAGIRDSAVIARALDDAAAMADGYLAARYRLPLSATSALMVDLVAVIAIYKLHRETVPDKIRADYEDGLKRLADLSAGRIRLDVAGIEPAGNGSAGILATDQDRLFTADSLKGFV